jgi:hypothetical protein
MDCPSCRVRIHSETQNGGLTGREAGLFLHRYGVAIRDQAFDGDDQREGLDLGGSAATGHFGSEVGDLPKTGQDLAAAKVEAAQFSVSCSTSCCWTAARCSSM